MNYTTKKIVKLMEDVAKEMQTIEEEEKCEMGWQTYERKLLDKLEK